jgi:hypothetical protein
MLTATHQHALLETKSKKSSKLERKYYSQYVLKFDVPTLFYVLKCNLLTWRNVLRVRISNLST